MANDDLKAMVTAIEDDIEDALLAHIGKMSESIGSHFALAGRVSDLMVNYDTVVADLASIKTTIDGMTLDPNVEAFIRKCLKWGSTHVDADNVEAIIMMVPDLKTAIDKIDAL